MLNSFPTHARVGLLADSVRSNVGEAIENTATGDLHIVFSRWNNTGDDANALLLSRYQHDSMPQMTTSQRVLHYFEPSKFTRDGTLKALDILLCDLCYYSDLHPSDAAITIQCSSSLINDALTSNLTQNDQLATDAITLLCSFAYGSIQSRLGHHITLHIKCKSEYDCFAFRISLHDRAEPLLAKWIIYDSSDTQFPEKLGQTMMTGDNDNKLIFILFDELQANLSRQPGLDTLPTSDICMVELWLENAQSTLKIVTMRADSCGSVKLFSYTLIGEASIEKRSHYKDDLILKAIIHVLKTVKTNRQIKVFCIPCKSSIWYFNFTKKPREDVSTKQDKSVKLLCRLAAKGKFQELVRLPTISINERHTDFLNRTPLLCAAAAATFASFGKSSKSHTNCAISLICCGADPNVADEEGWTAVHSAVKSSNNDLLEFLLKIKDIKVNCSSNDGSTPLMIAAYADNAEAAKLLLNADSSTFEKKSEEVKRVESICISIKSSDVREVIKKWRNREFSPFPSGSLSCLMMLEAEEKKMKNFRNIAMQSVANAVYFFSPTESAPIVSRITGAINDPELQTMCLKEAEGQVHLLSLHQQDGLGKVEGHSEYTLGVSEPQTVSLAAYSVTQDSYSELMAIQSLASEVIEGNYSQVRSLATEQLVKATTQQHNSTVLILSADVNTRENGLAPWQYAKCVELLMHMGADPTAADNLGNTAAHVAARQDNLQMMALLPFDAKFLLNNDKRTSLMEATLAESWRCAKHLLHLFRQFRHYEKKDELLNARDKDGRTALDMAKDSGQKDLVEVIQTEMRLVVSVFAKGERRTHPHEMPYQITGLTDEETSQRKNLNHLMRKSDIQGLRQAATRVNIDLPASYGETVLIKACSHSSNQEIIKFLSQLADPTVSSLDGASCLLWAGIDSDCGVPIQYLVRAGASVNYQDQHGRTSLMRAAYNKNGGLRSITACEILHMGANWQLEGKELVFEDTEFESSVDLCTRFPRPLPSDFQNREFFDEPVEPPPPYLMTWEVLQIIGRGAYGDVNEVITDKSIRCAVKTIRLPFNPDSEGKVNRSAMKLFQAERNFYKLNHENIVKFLYITFPEDHQILLFMELLDAESLEKYRERNTLYLYVDKICVLTRQICSALQYLHSQQPPVIHRDIKPSNIMVIDGSQIKLIDFGLSLKLSATHYIGTSTGPRGTENFMAPELFGSEDSEKMLYSKESDIWAFGCTVYHMVTGNVPYSGFDMVAISRKLDRYGAPLLPANRCSSLLRNFYHRCVAKERTKRCSAEELLKHEFLI